MNKRIYILYITVILFSMFISKESMLTNFHFHRLADGTVIVHSHKKTNANNHKHTNNEIITLDKYYNTISRITDTIFAPELFREIEKAIYIYSYNSITDIYTAFIYGHYP